MQLFLDGKEIMNPNNMLGPNLLDGSVGPFKLENPQKKNYVIFDKTRVNLIKGRKYCISCQTDGALINKPFDGTTPDGSSFQLYLYNTNDPSSYFLVEGAKAGNSIAFNYGRSTAVWKLCIQYKGIYDKIIGKAPAISQVKVEEGTMPTKWIPSSNDLATAISKMGGRRLTKPLVSMIYTILPEREVA